MPLGVAMGATKRAMSADPREGGGAAIASFRIAVTTRRPTGTGSFENGETTYLTCTVFGALTAENVAESLKRGDRVVVVGRIVERSFTATRGERRGETVRRCELVVDEIGPSLRFAIARPTKTRSATQPATEDDPSV
jgi:single-strand DNA-binding protein